jgi:hypothetical protein
MSQTNTSVSTDESEYNKLVALITPFTRSLSNSEKQAAFDFRILLICAINKEKLLTLMYLNNGIKNLIKYFTPEFNKMVNREVMWDDSDSLIQFNKLHFIALELMQQMRCKDTLEETNYIFMNIGTESKIIEELMSIYH